MGGGEFALAAEERLGQVVGTLSSKQWYWIEYMRFEGVLDAVITAGTVTATNASTAVTFTTGPTPSVVDFRFRPDTDLDLYRIAAHTAGATAATLNVAYTGTTGAGKTYRLMRFEYSLPADTIRIVSPIYFFRDDRKCSFTNQDEITKYISSGATISGTPEKFAMIGDTEIIFNRYGSDTPGTRQIFEGRAFVRPADLTNSASEEPDIPRQWRHVLSDLAVYMLFVDKDDTRAALIGKQVESTLFSMRVENRAILDKEGEGWRRLSANRSNRPRA